MMPTSFIGMAPLWRSNGKMPPHPEWYISQPSQTYGLGPTHDGVLAVRVLKLPPPPPMTVTGGGFEHPPHIGSPEAIAKFKDYVGLPLASQQPFGFGLSTLYFLTSFLSFVAWLRNRSQKLLFWLAAYTLCRSWKRCLVCGCPLPVRWLVFLIQSSIQLREISQWFLLLYLAA